MATEPKYDEDVVNLGYLKKIVADPEGNIENIYENVSKHYASKPQPPYHKGDTWIDGNIIYTCINDREIGTYQDSDWTTESGAKEEAGKKNKVFLRQPSNYNVGDMWILQSDEDHKAGKRGEILISTAGRKEYNENDWVNMLGYGTIASINEVANNLNDAIERIGVTEEAIADGLIVTFYQATIPEGKHIGDLWYVTETVDEYIKGKLYRYNGEKWEILKDPEITQAFEEANEARIVADGKIQSFYTATAPLENVGVGDLWIDTDDNNKLYRYNGTNWVAVYDTRIDTIQKEVETVTETTVEIQTDLGQINNRVNTVETTITKWGQIEKAEGQELVVDASNNPAKLFVYGNTFQETRSGKNLVNVFVTPTTNTGFSLPDLSISEDGFVTYENTSGYRTVLFNTFEAEPNTTYYSYLEIIESTVTPIVYLREFDENMGVVKTSYPKNQTFVTTESTKYIQYGLTTNAYTATGKFKARPMIIKSNVADNVYEQYGIMPSTDYPSDIRNVGDNINLFDKDNANILIGFFNINHTSIQTSTVSYCAYIPIEGGLTYTVSKLEGVRLNVGTTSVIPKVGTELIDNAGNQDKLGNAKNGEECTIKTSLNANYLVVQYCSTNADTESEENLRNSIKIEEGSKATSYSEYGCGSVGIKIENKNKINLGELTTSSNAGLTSKTEKSVWKITGTSNTNGYANSTGRISIGKIKAGTYTFSWNYIGKLPYNETNYATISIYNVKTGNVIVSKRVDIDDKSEQFTLTEDTELKLGIWNVGSGNVYDVEFYLQLEEGEKTDYEEHQEQIVSFPLSQGQLLHKGDYLAEDGIHQIRKTIVLDGTENWSRQVYKNQYYFRLEVDNTKTLAFDVGLCSHLTFIKSSASLLEYKNAIRITGGNIDIVLDTSAMSLEDFTTILSNQYTNGTPVTIEYELAEEIVIPYTTEQQKVLDSIETFKGINHIYCIDEIEPERMILEYYPNTPYNDTLVNKDTFDKVTSEMNAEINIKANEVETSVRESTTANILTLLNNGYLTAEQVNALVNGNTEAISTIKDQLTQTVTSSQMKIEITKAIEGGVSYLKNTLFTIDENGMAIATSEDEFNALYNNKGMYLYSFEELIARFDIDGSTIQGNLTLEGEFITPNLRMMNIDVDEVPHVHIHWIGG